MPIITGCCCFEKLEAGSRGSAVFTSITGMINIAIDIWILVNLHHMDRVLEDNEKEIWLPPGIIAFIYIELIFNLVVIGLGMLLWVGINFRYDGKKMVFTWMWGMFATRVYQLFLMMFVLIWIGGHRVSDVVFVVPETIVVAMYWMLNCIILVAAMICVMSYWQELLDEIHGKERRRRHFVKITNVRAAARMRSGTATPLSYYASRSTLFSQPSAGGHSAHPSYRSQHPSVSSQALLQEKPPMGMRPSYSQHPSVSSQGVMQEKPPMGMRPSYGQHPSVSSQPGVMQEKPSSVVHPSYSQHPSVSSQGVVQEKPPMGMGGRGQQKY